MRANRFLLTSFLWLAVCWVGFSRGGETAAVFEDDFDAGAERWLSYFDAGTWHVEDGVFRSSGKAAVSARLAKSVTAADAMIQADVRFADEGRRNAGLVLRAEDNRMCAVVRFYDRGRCLELLTYEKGEVTKRIGNASAVPKPGEWYSMKAAAIGKSVFGKIWPAGSPEPDWQLRGELPSAKSGGAGLMVQNGSKVDFRNVLIWTGAAVEKACKTPAAADGNGAVAITGELTADLKPTPFVHHAPNGPARQVNLRILAGGKPIAIDGSLSLSLGGVKQSVKVEKSKFDDDGFQLLVPEPEKATELAVSFIAASGKKAEARCTLKPSRKWTFFMTPHTHYDIGFTAPQLEVIERLTRDMDTAEQYCRKTADWPADCRYRWTVEVSGLMQEYIRRHTKEQVSRFMELVKDGRAEICGYYLNMPTEVVGHEELIRCLYYAQQLRKEYGVRIDTAMLNDVPGYTWALPAVLSQAGIKAVSFRANSIRGNFLWHRPGAVPRPFYWQSPDGSRVFTWYTDSYREGNFFRSPGLQEKTFAGIIRRNEEAGYPFDEVQLRMGGDNLPPNLNTSVNAKAWNEKYVWPKVVVATNRDFLELLESRHGGECKTFRGDIPSWWADGPASSAMENGMVRLLHDRLCAVESLWTMNRLANPGLSYPRDEIRQAYEKMIHFDEHTWGASQSIAKPKGEQTVKQWQFKAAFAYDAQKLTDKLMNDALAQVSAKIRSPEKPAIAVWNPLAWTRDDVAAIPLDGAPFENAAEIRLTDLRSGKTLPAQICGDRRQAVFVARDLPPLGCAIYTVEPMPSAPKTENAKSESIENQFYRVTVDHNRGGLVSWRDKQLNRELLDQNAKYSCNQAIHEKSLDGRDAITSKKPTRFKYTVPQNGKFISRVSGPVFQEITWQTSLPTLPMIRQRARLYNELKILELENTVTKEESFEPDGVYFAFPFDAPSPDIHLQIADAEMRPGKDQLTHSCQDFFSIQHYADVSGKNFGVIFAPLESPLVSASGLNAYRWADKIDFNNGHIYSWVMSNTWICNFRAGQSGTMPFRYRLTSYPGQHDAIRATRFAWQPFYPPAVVWLQSANNSSKCNAPAPLIEIDGDQVIASCLKMAEDDDRIIVRVREVRGKPANAVLKFELPGGHKIAKATLCNCVEQPVSPLETTGKAVKIELQAHGIATIALTLDAR